ncbi:MAG: hypothetical protein HC890_14725 [Chloroflexaceae bacterium]|nr:hypothetical protein [Chloroflexaceae bacterium]
MLKWADGLPPGDRLLTPQRSSESYHCCTFFAVVVRCVPIRRRCLRRQEFSMNPHANQPAESKASLAEVPDLLPSSETPTTEESQLASLPSRQHPIPPPSNPRQYRAIGLVQGRYEFQEQMTRGLLHRSDGITLDAVLLGRVISLVKNHLDLNQEHLWVVYPRTRQENDELHVQIVGVWEPETLALPQAEPAPVEEVKDGYFSIRGEVIFYLPTENKIIVKIRQAARQESEPPKFFKLKLTGTLEGRPVGRFWELEVQLNEQILEVSAATDFGPTRRKKPLPKKPSKPVKKI